jgi:hypothetical protein
MASADLSSLVAGHVARFNAAVRSGSYNSFVAGFAVDAEMTFVGVPVGPFTGRPSILRAYSAQPPTDTMTVTSVSGTPADAAVRFAWDHGGTGTMHLSWSDDQLTRLEISFD